ncbi:nucleoside-diphosphate-sugar epimerase family protein [Rutstroemia sp. NJR-2017a WRK4]|nr:nucleoside-diphosphate-sugar epimerase family protein [Rutstroemia sp. NJR-2017a WRK4]PQE11787.1 nucleoside-diphosphate-sugar epimerase family protein [Rutstroemia sp. NJR-2017a WRK4]
MAAILITGATGKQGGSVIRSLIKCNAPFTILAVTRNAHSPSALKLAQTSPKIKLVEGDLDDPAALFRTARSKLPASTPIWGVFSVQVAKPKSDIEKRQGIALIDESIKQNVKHFVYSSVDRGGSRSSSNPTKIPHFIYKHEIEQHLMASTSTSSSAAGETSSAMDWTILRPTAFFENFTPDYLGKVFTAAWEMTLKENKSLQMIATSDIGSFAAKAFMNPEEAKGKMISLAGDDLTYEEMERIFKEKTGREVPTTWKLPVKLMMLAVKELGVMFKWFGEEGYNADVKELKKEEPELKDFGTWLETESRFETREKEKK